MLRTDAQTIYKHDFGEESKFRMECTDHAIHRGEGRWSLHIGTNKQQFIWHKVERPLLKSNMGIFDLVLNRRGDEAIRSSLFTKSICTQ